MLDLFETWHSKIITKLCLIVRLGFFVVVCFVGVVVGFLVCLFVKAKKQVSYVGRILLRSCRGLLLSITVLHAVILELK